MAARKQSSGDSCEPLKVLPMLINIWRMEGFKVGTGCLEKVAVWRRKQQKIEVTFSIYGLATEAAVAKFEKHKYVSLRIGDAAADVFAADGSDEVMSE